MPSQEVAQHGCGAASSGHQLAAIQSCLLRRVWRSKMGTKTMLLRLAGLFGHASCEMKSPWHVAVDDQQTEVENGRSDHQT
jgi:hypothetical protein